MPTYKISGMDVSMSVQDYESYLALHSNDSHKKHIQSGRSKKIATLNTEEEVAQAQAKNLVEEVASSNFHETPATPAQVRQQERRKQYFQNVLAKASIRAAPGTGHETITFEQFTNLQAAYQKALNEGYNHSEIASASGLGFQPTAIYSPKLIQKRKDGSVRVIRPLIQNEVGIRPNGRIMILEDKYPGDLGTNLHSGADLVGAK